MMYFLKKTSHLILNAVKVRSKPFLIPLTLKASDNVNKKIPYCTKREIYFPLDELPQLDLDSSKYDIDAWYKIIAELKFGRENGKNIPNAITLKHIEELLRLESFSQRFKYLKHLFKKEKKKLSYSDKKLKKKEKLIVNHTSDIKDNHIQYGLGKNTLMMATRKYSIHHFFNKKLAKAALFNQKMVFDLSYDDFMRTKERRDCAAQLRLVHSSNRRHCSPYDLYFCNASLQSHCFQYLQEEMPNICESLISITEKSYLDIFPKENLIYLSPHASETLKEYDHNAVYIVGAFVDMVKRERVSISKAEKEGIKSLCLPLDNYILWGSGSKSLSIDQVFSIMITLRDTGDWKKAFKHIPKRKIRKVEPDSNECKIASEKMFVLKRYN